MQNINALERLDLARYNFFSWRTKTGIAYKIILIIAMSCLSGILAQVKIYLPGTPVPVTGQSFAAAMSGILLGSVWGGASQILYVILGLTGIPWFAGAKAGLSVVCGPTGGYLMGFVLESLFIGYIIDNYIKSRKFIIFALLITAADYLFIFGFGLLQLNFWYNYAAGVKLTLSQLLMKGLMPFIPGEIVKVICTAGIATFIMPKRDYIK